MSCAFKLFRVSGVRMRRAGCLLFAGMLLGSSTGCTPFQTMCTGNWFEACHTETASEKPVNHMLTYWDNHVRIVQDTVNRGAPLPGLAGRLFLFNDDTQGSVDARGAVLVQMHDMTNVASGKPAPRLAEWRFDSESLKMLKRRDRIGEGYTLFLPWDQYRPDVKEVQLQICYIPEKGTPRYTEPQNLSLQSTDESVVAVQQRQVPAMTQRPFGKAVQQQPQEQIAPALPQQQQISSRN